MDASDIDVLKRLVDKYPNYPGLKDTLNIIVPEPIYDAHINRLIKRLRGLTFNQLNEALMSAKKGDIIICVQGTYKIFSDQTSFDTYVDNLICEGKLDEVPHYQIIRVEDPHKLIFVLDDATPLYIGAISVIEYFRSKLNLLFLIYHSS